ncbi:MAG TPA: riboflavin kinase [Candidatus Gracilibacteria bacterium]|nr:riboflavin kinase [Candidatus Gracilibacteria bacterium]
MDALFQIRGKVVEGRRVGRTLGFPTLNLEGVHEMPFGVYAGRVHTPLGHYKGALHYGPRGILGLEQPMLEVHLLDFEGDLYGESVVVDVYNKVRDVMPFTDHESLKKQIEKDVKEVRRLILSHDQISQE